MTLAVESGTGGKWGWWQRGREWGDWRGELLTVDDLPWDDHGTSFLKVTGYFQLLILTYLALHCLFYFLDCNYRALQEIGVKRSMLLSKISSFGWNLERVGETKSLLSKQHTTLHFLKHIFLLWSMILLLKGVSTSLIIFNYRNLGCTSTRDSQEQLKM